MTRRFLFKTLSQSTLQHGSHNLIISACVEKMLPFHLCMLEFVSIVLSHVMDHVRLKSFAIQTRSEVVATKQYYCTTIGYLVVIHQPDVTMQPQYRNYAQQVPQRSPHAANQRRGGIGKSAHFRPCRQNAND